MGAFRLMLCLAGLAIYVVIKQFTVGSTDEGLEPGKPTSPASGQLTPPKSERGTKPQTEPHTDILKREKALAVRAPI